MARPQVGSSLGYRRKRKRKNKNRRLRSLGFSSALPSQKEVRLSNRNQSSTVVSVLSVVSAFVARTEDLTSGLR